MSEIDKKDIRVVYYDIDKVRKKYPTFSEKKIETIAVYNTIVENISYQNNYPYQHLELNLDFFDDLPIEIKISELTFFIHYYLGFLIMDNKPSDEPMHSKIFTKEHHQVMTNRVKKAKDFLAIAPSEIRPKINEVITNSEGILSAEPMTITRIRLWLQKLNKDYGLNQSKLIKPLADNLKKHIK